MKNCTNCHEWKPVEAYYKHHKYLDGHQSRCKECTKSAAKKAYRESPITTKVRAKKRQRAMRSTIPPWNIWMFVEEAYSLSRLRTKMTGIEWHVDHIVPLNSPLVCGLHVHNNLQVIPAIQNMAKGNRSWPDMP